MLIISLNLKSSLIIYLGYFYVFLGTLFIVIPLIYIELGRPKDFIKAGLNLIFGIILIFKNKIFENSYPLIYFLLTFLIIFYLVEIFTYRWNQLTDKEKIKLTTVVELKNNLSKISEAFSLVISNLVDSLNFLKFDKKNENFNKKKVGKKWSK